VVQEGTYGTYHERKYAQPSTRDIALAKAWSSGLIIIVYEI
jgi:hypothetical protein